jgi:glycosyltransferase involved in cell wall biosynthesis
LVYTIVVADNCTDSTAEIARTCGAHVIERQDQSKIGKGYALNFAFNFVLNTQLAFDGLVVIDADAVVDSRLLTVFNNHVH